jgi:hypothetical protein
MHVPSTGPCRRVRLPDDRDDPEACSGSKRQHDLPWSKAEALPARREQHRSDHDDRGPREDRQSDALAEQQDRKERCDQRGDAADGGGDGSADLLDGEKAGEPSTEGPYQPGGHEEQQTPRRDLAHAPSDQNNDPEPDGANNHVDPGASVGIAAAEALTHENRRYCRKQRGGKGQHCDKTHAATLCNIIRGDRSLVIGDST